MVRKITLCMQGSTPLMVACRENHPKAAKELLGHNPNLNVTDQKVSPASSCHAVPCVIDDCHISPRAEILLIPVALQAN